MKNLRWLIPLLALFVAGCGNSPEVKSSSTTHTTTQETPQQLLARIGNNFPANHAPLYPKHEATVNRAPNTLVHLHSNKKTARPPVPATPTGPSGAWKVVYADNFSSTIGSGAGQDSGWKANTHDQGCCNNGDEVASERENKVRVGAEGLELLCSKESVVSGKSYNCGGADTNTPNGFKFKYSSEFVVQTRMKLPPASGCGEDPGWWASDPSWTDEFDYFEFWGWNNNCKYSGGIVWIYKTPSSSTRQQCEPWEGCGTWVPNPDGEYHTYTTVIKPNGVFEEWIEGKHRSTISGASPNLPWEHLIFTHALRQSGTSVAPKFTGTTALSVDYVAVYEIGTGNTEHAGVAPGTTVSGSEPTPEPKPEPTPEPTPTPAPDDKAQDEAAEAAANKTVTSLEAALAQAKAALAAVKAD